MQHTRTFSNWAGSPATVLNVSTHSRAPGRQLHLALGLSFVEAASPATPRPLSPAPGSCGPHPRLPFPPASSSEDLETPGATDKQHFGRALPYTHLLKLGLPQRPSFSDHRGCPSPVTARVLKGFGVESLGGLGQQLKHIPTVASWASGLSHLNSAFPAIKWG